MTTLILLVLLTTGESLSRPVPAAQCAELAARMIREPGISSASCWTNDRNMRPVFSTVAL